MSYILDALRRAEAERSSTQAPDLDRLGAISAPHALKGPGRQRAPRAWKLLAVVLAALTVLASGMVLRLRQTTPAPPPAAPSSQAPAARQADAPPLPEGSPARSGEHPSLDQPRSPLVEREQPSRLVLADAAASRPRVTSPEPNPALSGTAPQPAAGAGVPTLTSTVMLPTPLSAAAQPVAIPSRDELPPDVRRTLPPFGIGGTVYSPNPARRMLIVDGELWREGEQIRPDLVIEQIRSRDAVLRYRGLRFSVSP